ncbi:MAG: GNAT family N-acetyltransferase [Butyrivibrio sp.]|nr:GNAT family N-acetyltransferase [Butyrivibrio sp.]
MCENRILIRGEKVCLRLMEENDFPLIVSWRNKEHVRKNFIYREPFTLEGQYEWKRTMIDTGRVVQFMICEKNTLTPVGCVYLRDIDMDEKRAEYGIFIGEKEALGRGYGNESASLTACYARDELHLEKLMLRVFTRNTAAIKSYEHAGFTRSMDIPDVECSDGQKDDMIIMELRL